MESARAGAADGASLLERLDDMDAEELKATVHELLREQKDGASHPHSDTWASPPGEPGAAEHEHMDDSCLEHVLSADEAEFFETNGVRELRPSRVSSLARGG